MRYLITIAAFSVCFVAQAADNFSFIWVSDVHSGRANTFAAGEPTNNFQFISTNFGTLAYVFATGDLTEDGSDTNTAAFVGATVPVNSILKPLPGNHDECPGIADAEALCDQTYAQYDAAFPNSRHWSVTNGSLVFIGFTSYWVRTNGPATISSNELYCVRAAITNAAGKNVVLLTHFPWSTAWGYEIAAGHGREELAATIAWHGNIKAWFSGHRHLFGDTASVTNGNNVLVNVNGPSLAYCDTGPSWRLDGAFFYGAVSNSAINLYMIQGNDPTYTWLGTNWSIGYTSTSRSGSAWKNVTIKDARFR